MSESQKELSLPSLNLTYFREKKIDKNIIKFMKKIKARLVGYVTKGILERRLMKQLSR